MILSNDKREKIMSSLDFQGSDMTFDLPKNRAASIKVIGVGGGGTNAVNYMFNQGIHGVDFVVCNTDAQALNNSPVPSKVQLGVSLTEGLGAGANPEVGKKAAVESADELKGILSSQTKMVFITAGMGGGTGTGAAPVIASIARDLDILTVGIVTVPFCFEGKKRLEQARAGIERMRKHVDSLITINNEKLRELYGNLGFKEGFSKADSVLSTAAKGIAEVITHHFTQNIDLHDVKTVLANSGTAIMGSATASGENRAKEGITRALDSPLLNNNKITGSQNVLLLIVSGTKEITMDEIATINEHIQSQAGNSADIIMGIGEDENLQEGISITVVATGFSASQQEIIVDKEEKKVYHTLKDEQPITKTMAPRAGELVEDDEPLNGRAPSEKIYDVEPSDLKPSLKQKMSSDKVLNQPLSEPDENTDPRAQPSDQRSFAYSRPLGGATGAPAAQPTPEEAPAPSSEVREEAITRHELPREETAEAPTASPIRQKQDKADAYLRFEVKKRGTDKEPTPENEALKNPFEGRISEVMTRKALERKERLRAYEYPFEPLSEPQVYGEEPAYKRKGIDPSEEAPQTSRFSLDIGENNEIRLRDNNSFLHDNVD